MVERKEEEKRDERNSKSKQTRVEKKERHPQTNYHWLELLLKKLRGERKKKRETKGASIPNSFLFWDLHIP